MKPAHREEVIGSLAWGGSIAALALGAAFAHRLSYIDSDAVTRMVIGINGFMMAWYGNRIPKAIVPSAMARRAQRVAGWSLVLSGLFYAGVFAFAPLPVAATVGTAAVLAGIVVTLGYCLSLRSKAKAS